MKPQAQTQKTQNGAPRQSRMGLANVVRGRIEKPLRILMFGTEGIGKSTFAASMPAPIFLGAEDGTSELDVARFPQPTTWEDALDAIAELTRAEHDFKTLAIDTLDWLEPLCWQHVCVKGGVKSIEDFGFGKGYTAALDEWRVLLAALEGLRSRRDMGICLLAHCWIKSFKNPTADDYDRYELKLHAKAGGLLKEWCDAVLFANYETYTHTDKQKRVRGVSTGARIIHTQRTAAWDAKNRHDLPETLPLDYHEFAAAVAAHRPQDPGKLRERIAAMLEAVDDADLRAKVEETVAKAPNDAAHLARVANRLSAKLQIQENDQ